MTDRIGADKAVFLVLVGLSIILTLIHFAAATQTAIFALVAFLGAFTYAAVPAMQARVIWIAEMHAPKALAAAAGLNIAGFNSGIALGSLLVGKVISIFRVANSRPFWRCRSYLRLDRLANPASTYLKAIN